MEENPLMEKMDDEVKMKKLCVRILPKFLKKVIIMSTTSWKKIRKWKKWMIIKHLKI